ncbi:MAG: class I SAM-dependent RNA methyltransferase [Bacilli bacterium]
MYNIGESYLFKVISQDHYGFGIAKENQQIIFIKGALPKETVLALITGKKKGMIFSEVKEIKEASSERVMPRCKGYGVCGGCSLQHQNYLAQLSFKEEKVREILKKFANYEGDIEKIVSSKEWNYRNKVVFHVNNRKLCFYQDKTNISYQVDECLLLPDEMNALIIKINKYLKENKPFNDIMIRENKNGEMLISLTGELNKELFCKELSAFKIVGIIANKELIKGTDYIIDTLFNKKFLISNPSFYQVNRYQTEQLYEIVIDMVKDIKPKKVLDLYCGTGTIGILISSYVNEVVGVEVENSSIINANKNKELNKIENITFYLGKVEDKIESFKNYDFLIVDPPRAGLKKEVTDVIKKLKPLTIVYISCDPVTLARDINQLKEYYQVLKIKPVDMFPNTSHVECVCVMKLHQTL